MRWAQQRLTDIASPPARGRGSKHVPITDELLDRLVASCAGAWIETSDHTALVAKVEVASRAEAWIETTISRVLSLRCRVPPA